MDLYTKAVLTVIAAALCALVAQNTIATSQAQSGAPMRVALCDPDSGLCAAVENVMKVGSGKSGALSTRLAK
jgi:hypothetical protein